jgi:hypothetical protein
MSLTERWLERVLGWVYRGPSPVLAAAKGPGPQRTQGGKSYFLAVMDAACCALNSAVSLAICSFSHLG